MVADEGVLPNFRRNGQKPSCEPCRKSKYRCDHIQPICERCQTRGIPDKCTYHPAPMKGRTISKVKKPAQQHPLPSPRPASSKESATPISSPTPRPRQSSISTEPAEEYGFLGSTAYNAVFTDNQEHLILHLDSAKPNNEAQRYHDQSLACERQHRLVNLQMREAIFVLQCLQDFPHLEKILARWSKFERSCCLIGPWADDCAESIRKELYETNALKNEKSMLVAAEKLFANTEAKIKVTKDLRFCEFSKLYTGQNLRWEALGLFFTAIGFAMNDLDAPEDCFTFVGRQEESKQTLWDRILRASNACVEFTDDVSNQSDLGLWIMLDNSILSSQILGDAHYLVWRKVGDVSTAIYARGLHQQRESTNVPFWLQEMRNIALGYAYASDKTLCTFVGRPPRISQRYCTIKIPLDLEYEDLALEGADLQNALNKIGPDGWNPETFSKPDRKSVERRPLVINALLREDVLELCLGPSGPNHREKVFDCIRRNQETYNSLPQAIQLPPESWLLHDKKIGFPAARQFMDFLYNEFMLRRVLVRRYHDDPTELLQIAHKMLTAVIESRNIRGVRSVTTACMAWILVLYGLPAAGVLAVELLQLNGKGLNHTKIKQDLCVITSYLKWIHVPGDGNYHLVEQARTTLQHILDKALMPESAPTPVPNGVAPETPISVGDNVGPAIDLGGQDFSWFDGAGQFDADFWASLMNLDQPINT